MSARKVTYAYLNCDECGMEFRAYTIEHRVCKRCVRQMVEEDREASDNYHTDPVREDAYHGDLYTDDI